MTCEAILGNTGDPAFRAAAVDEVELDWRECRRRFLRKRSRHGRDVGILLPAGTVMRHGDVLYADGEVIVAVCVMPCRVIVLPIQTAAAANVAYALGEMHVPIEIVGDAIVTPADDAVAAVLRRLGYRGFGEEMRRFSPVVSAASEWTVS